MTKVIIIGDVSPDDFTNCDYDRVSPLEAEITEEKGDTIVIVKIRDLGAIMARIANENRRRIERINYRF
jgi:bifunctional ADP-heptose synthase (sugar kinase/adenylyltransferase)